MVSIVMYLLMCIYYVYTLCISFSLGQTASFKKKIFFFFCALWRICLEGIFFMNKGFDAYSFLCEMGSIVPWGKLHSENQSSCDPLCVLFCFFVCFLSLLHKLNFAEFVCNLLVCLMKFGWGHLLHCWSEILLIT